MFVGQNPAARREGAAQTAADSDPQAPRLESGGHSTSFSKITVLATDHKVGRHVGSAIRADFGHRAGAQFPPHERGVRAGSEQMPSGLMTSPCCFERDVGIDPRCKRLLFPVEAVVVAPVTTVATSSANGELPLANTVRQFDAGERDLRGLERLESQHGGAAAFDRSMVLLDNVVQIPAVAHRDTLPPRVPLSQQSQARWLAVLPSKLTVRGHLSACVATALRKNARLPPGCDRRTTGGRRTYRAGRLPGTGNVCLLARRRRFRPRARRSPLAARIVPSASRIPAHSAIPSGESSYGRR
jgi:hypothetical protein